MLDNVGVFVKTSNGCKKTDFHQPRFHNSWPGIVVMIKAKHVANNINDFVVKPTLNSRLVIR